MLSDIKCDFPKVKGQLERIKSVLLTTKALLVNPKHENGWGECVCERGGGEA